MPDLSPSRCAVLATGQIHGESPASAGLRELERRGYSVGRIGGDKDLDLLRSQAVAEVLSRGFAETLWIDTQIEFDPNYVVQLQARQIPFVAGVCPQAGGRGLALEFLPGTSRVDLGIGGGLLEIQYASAAFLHVRKEVYESLSSGLKLPLCHAPAGPPFTPYFMPLLKEGSQGSKYLCSDFAFCERARQCGFAIVADTTIRLWRHDNYRYSWEDVAGGRPRPSSCELRVGAPLNSPAAAEGTEPTPRPRGPFQSPELEALRQAHPWPELKPPVAPRENEGWLFPSTQEMLARFLSNETKLVVELGSWLGLSTRFIASRAPRATVIAVDHWQGSPEHQQDAALRELLPRLYGKFLVNCWDDRARIIPLRAGTLAGLQRVADFGLQPDLVYVDADHDFEAVAADLHEIQRLFPRAIIVGDDWNWEGVRRAATAFSTTLGGIWKPWRRVGAFSRTREARVKKSANSLTLARFLITCQESPP